MTLPQFGQNIARIDIELADILDLNIVAPAAGDILIYDGDSWDNQPVTGAITITASGLTAIAPGVIVDADISATAEIAVSKLADGAARQVLQTDALGTGVEWTDNVDLPGTLDVTGVATFDTRIVLAEGSAGAAGLVYIARDNDGDLTLNALDGKAINFAINGLDEIQYTTGTMAFQQATTISAAGSLTLASASGADVLIGDGATLLHVDGGSNTIGIGIAAVPRIALNIDHLTTNPTGATRGVFSQIRSAATVGASAQAIHGLFATAIIDDTNTQNWTLTVSLRGVDSVIQGEAGSSGTVTGGSAFYAENAALAGITLTNQYGSYYEALTTGTNNYAIYINTPTGTIADAIHVVGGRVYLGGNTEIDSGAVVKSAGATEIGLQVTNGVLTVGTSGSLEAPYLASTGAAFSDAIGGNLDGCFGFNRDTDTGPTNTLEVRMNGAWVSVALTGFLMQRALEYIAHPDIWVHPDQIVKGKMHEDRCVVCGEELQIGDAIMGYANARKSNGALHGVYGHTHLERDAQFSSLAERLEAIGQANEILGAENAALRKAIP